KLDPEKFEEHQKIFIEEIVRSITTKLIEAGLEGEKMEQITADIGFSIASIIDDTTQIESDGVLVKPYLTFRENDDELIHCGENSYSYEFVIPTLKKLFDV
ncbi:MAG: hypothetical protein ACWA5Q_02775, partial [bacterium]